MCSLYSFSRPVPCSPIMGLLMAILPGCTLSPARTRCNIGWAIFLERDLVHDGAVGGREFQDGEQ
jgi:hypothetical protein